jgi:hypothetical protein
MMEVESAGCRAGNCTARSGRVWPRPAAQSPSDGPWSRYLCTITLTIMYIST